MVEYSCNISSGHKVYTTMHTKTNRSRKTLFTSHYMQFFLFFSMCDNHKWEYLPSQIWFKYLNLQQNVQFCIFTFSIYIHFIFAMEICAMSKRINAIMSFEYYFNIIVRLNLQNHFDVYFKKIIIKSYLYIFINKKVFFFRQRTLCGFKIKIL